MEIIVLVYDLVSYTGFDSIRGIWPVNIFFDLEISRKPFGERLEERGQEGAGFVVDLSPLCAKQKTSNI